MCIYFKNIFAHTHVEIGEKFLWRKVQRVGPFLNYFKSIFKCFTIIFSLYFNLKVLIWYFNTL